MFSQFRAQYPQGRIQTEMLPKIDGLHAFRAIVSQGDAIMGTATAVDSDLEIAEDRAIKRALTIAGITFEHSFEGYGDYAGRSPILTQVSRESATINSLPSAHLQPQLESVAKAHSEPIYRADDDYGDREILQETSHYGDPVPSQVSNQFASNVSSQVSNPISNPVSNQMSSAMSDPVISSSPNLSPNTSPSPSSVPISAPMPISAEPIDLSDAISKIDVEMDRLGWTKQDGRDYLLRNFEKRTRQELTNQELSQFLNHLKSLPSPMRQSNLANEEFF